MNSLLTIHTSQTPDDPIFGFVNILVTNVGEPKYVWKEIKTIIKDFKNEPTFEELVTELLYLDNYEETSIYVDNETKNVKLDYYIDVLYEDTVIQFIAYNSVNYGQRIECFHERYIYNSKNEGNCIDDFIRRGIEPLIDNINDLKESIKSRLPQRQIAVEYHSTGCYEKDFTQITLLKKQAEKIVENCNKHLERISEFYTRL